MNEKPEDFICLHVVVEGRVQGVGYRYFVEEIALSYGLHGWVRNLRNGSVEVMTEGNRNKQEQLLAALHRGPRAAAVTRLDVEWLPATEGFNRFSIRMTE